MTHALWVGDRTAPNATRALRAPRPRPVPPLLGDSTLVAWYRCPYAPRTGGAYDSHHRTEGIAGCTQRRGSGVAARGARTAAGDAGDWVPQRQLN